jgi:hypothetical protein
VFGWFAGPPAAAARSAGDRVPPRLQPTLVTRPPSIEHGQREHVVELAAGGFDGDVLTRARGQVP